MQRIKSKNRDIVDETKGDSFPSLRCVRRPKAEIFVEMFRTKLQSLVRSRHVGGPPWSSKMAAEKWSKHPEHLELTLAI